MKYRNFVKLGIVLALFISTQLIGQAQSIPHTVNGRKVLTSFADQKFPTGFTKERLTSLLQKAVDTMYLKGFRYLGDEEDFYHGHILYIKNIDGQMEAVAILYHTQENAYNTHADRPGSKYDYLNRKTRNWIQWLADEHVDNASTYKRISYPNTIEWRNYVKYNLPTFKERYTIHEAMLDPEYLGGEVCRSVQFAFYVFKNSGSKFDPESNIIQITLPTQQIILLALINESI